MPRSLPCRVAGLALAASLALTGCGAEPESPEPRAPQVSGTLHVTGLRAPVQVVRDRWGIPHIAAGNDDDLFLAQGFVQAQDRLFQMDLWKRAAQGRLAEVLGSNFIQRDSMTRRLQFRGDYDREWASYGPDVRRVATAFVSGINAWVRMARQDLPEEFVLAGWAPEYWKPEDLLNRTDAFLDSTGALDELFRGRLVAAVGAQRADALFPLPARARTIADPRVDYGAITYVVSDVVRRIGTPPFFLALAAPVTPHPRPAPASSPVAARAPVGDQWPASLVPPLAQRGRVWLVDAGRSSTGAPLVAASLVTRYQAPSARYLVHLSAPGLNVIGATSPWMPGVAIGHNDEVAWAFAPVPADTEDVYVERVNPANPHQVQRDGRWVDMHVDLERLGVKGRAEAAEYERQYTPNGAVIAQDRERGLVYTLRWSGTDYGGAGELAAATLARATSASDFAGRLSHWKMPVAEFVFADRAGASGRQTVGLLPARGQATGHLPAAGWDSRNSWQGTAFVRGATEAASPFGGGSVGEMERVQTDVSSPGARTLLALLDLVRLDDPAGGPAAQLRAQLLAWNGDFDASGSQPLPFYRLEAALRHLLASRTGVPADLIDDVALRVDPVTVLSNASRAWLGESPVRARDRLMIDGLLAAAEGAGDREPARVGPPTLVFSHPLAVFDEAKARFDIGPFARRGGRDTVLASDGSRGSTFMTILDVTDWEHAVAVNPPGESGSPASVHYDDLARPWSRGEYMPLTFAPSRLDEATRQTLSLEP